MAYVVNPRGAVHSVADHRLEELLRDGFRTATADEIAGWYARQGLTYRVAVPEPVVPAKRARRKREGT